MFLLLVETPSVQRDKESGESGRSEEVVGFRGKGLKLLHCLRLIWWLALNVCPFSCSNTTISTSCPLTSSSWELYISLSTWLEVQLVRPDPRYTATHLSLSTSHLSIQSEYNAGSCPELFASLQLCYQAGVFVSRSSLGIVKIRRVEVLSVLQFINMVVWVLLPVVRAHNTEYMR